ncbi:unnamed protein product [Withania somnifera]
MEKFSTDQDYSSLSCEIQIIRARNIEQISSLGKSNLFVRCCLQAGNNRRSVNMMKQGTVIFEIRSRKYLSVFGKNIGGSQLLGKAEIPWKRVFESTEMEIEEWTILTAPSKNINEDVKPPAVKTAMKVKVKEATKVNKNNRLRKSWDESCACKGYCGCNSSNIFSADDYEIFALGAALDALN